MSEARPTCGSCGQAAGSETPPRAPSGLGTAGKALWHDVTRAYALDPHERHVLREACRTADEIRRVEQALDAEPSLSAKGSQGQLVEHPWLGSLRNHRQTMDRLIARLNLPDAQGNVLTEGQRRSATANGARWAERRAEKELRRGA